MRPSLREEHCIIHLKIKNDAPAQRVYGSHLGFAGRRAADQFSDRSLSKPSLKQLVKTASKEPGIFSKDIELHKNVGSSMICMHMTYG